MNPQYLNKLMASLILSVPSKSTDCSIQLPTLTNEFEKHMAGCPKVLTNLLGGQKKAEREAILA